MKKLFNLTLILSIVALTLASCGGDDSTPAPTETQAEKISKLLNGKVADEKSTTQDKGGDVAAWADLKLTFASVTTEKATFTVSGAPTDADLAGVWTNGETSFTIADAAAKTVTRADGQVMTVTPGTSTLTLEFNVPAPSSARTAVVEGKWSFTFDIK